MSTVAFRGGPTVARTAPRHSVCGAATCHTCTRPVVAVKGNLSFYVVAVLCVMVWWLVGWRTAVSPLPCLLRVHVVRAVCGCLSCNSPCPLSRLSCAVWRPAVSVLSYLVPVVLTRPVLVIVSPVSPGHRSFNFSIDLSGHPAAVLASRGRGRGALARGACVQRSSTPTATSCQLQPRTSCFIRSHVVGSGNLRRAAMYNSSVTV